MSVRTLSNASAVQLVQISGHLSKCGQFLYYCCFMGQFIICAARRECMVWRYVHVCLYMVLGYTIGGMSSNSCSAALGFGLGGEKEQRQSLTHYKKRRKNMYLAFDCICCNTKLNWGLIWPNARAVASCALAQTRWNTSRTSGCLCMCLHVFPIL